MCVPVSKCTHAGMQLPVAEACPASQCQGGGQGGPGRGEVREGREGGEACAPKAEVRGEACCGGACRGAGHLQSAFAPPVLDKALRKVVVALRELTWPLREADGTGRGPQPTSSSCFGSQSESFCGRRAPWGQSCRSLPAREDPDDSLPAGSAGRVEV